MDSIVEVADFSSVVMFCPTPIMLYVSAITSW